ncbi:MAG: spherulation-specific family 4 protein [Planctomycetales bacterium]|nr:spherulation-specific family 4 protein [Planctomycetales bacterium]
MKVASATLFILMASVGLSNKVAAQTLRILVPAYANPCCDGGPEMWENLVAVASSPDRNFELFVIFNPLNGPGTAVDPNYLQSDGSGPLPELHAAGAIVQGYVASNYSQVSLQTLKEQIDVYFAGFWAGHVDGIFIDEMSADIATTGYYQELTNYVKSISPQARVIGNPGYFEFSNPSSQNQFSPQQYVNSVDTIITFENTNIEYTTNYSPDTVLSGLPCHKTGHIIHTLSSLSTDTLNLVANRGAGFVYATTGVLNTPYDQDALGKLTGPTGLAQLVAQVNATRFVLGDANGDCLVNNLDISGFILALTDPAAFRGRYPFVDYHQVLDFNGDSQFNNLDIGGFVQLLSGN